MFESAEEELVDGEEERDMIRLVKSYITVAISE
jgi:hypothetical protein